MEAFLKSNSLDRLCDALNSTLTLDESVALLDEGRPALLAKLKELGVRKPPDLSAFAKAVANARREIMGSGAPVLVCMYSAGVTQTSGNSLLAPCISAAKAKGLTDVVVLDHHNFPPFDAHTDFTVYVQALYDTVIAGQADRTRRGCSWRIRTARPAATASRGCSARGCGVCRPRPPRRAHRAVDAVFGCATGLAIKELGLHKLTQQLARVYVNPTLEAATSDEDAGKWLPMFKEVADIVMAQYSSPVSLCDAEGIEKAIGSSPAKIGAPITAVVSRTETEKGETREKVARWAELTKGAFALEVAECDHMDLPANPAVIKLFADEVARVVGESKPNL